MIDADLERRTADCMELIDAWRTFLDLVNRAMKPPKTVTPQLEQQFLSSKARIAMLHDSFMDSLKHDRNTGQNMLEIVNRAITLKLLEKMSEPERKKLEIEWHECFLLLNETVTSLNEDRARLAEINEFAHNIKKVREKIMLNLRATVHSFYFKMLVAIIIIVGTAAAFAMTPADNWLRSQGWGKGIAGSYMDFMRGIGVNMSYLSFQAFREQISLQADKVGGNVSNVSNNPDDMKEEAAISSLMNQMYLNNASPTLRQDWEKAQSFDVYKYDSRRNQSLGRLFLFFFEDQTAAKPALTTIQMNSSSMPDSFEVYQKANIIAIIYSTDGGMRETIKQNVLDPIKPKTK